jgi:phosphoribosylaminoimidazolecarboxamide formyltransferase / IMP cyclohydrolase
MRALISVSDKTGVVEFARALSELNIEIISTGGTFKTLKEAGIPVTPIDRITGFPECLDGRVKTLHPAVHGGILARRDLMDHMNQIKELGIDPIDIVAINLYPFKATIQKPGVTLEEAIENIDIGGPAMLRSSAKNHDGVIVLCDPADYDSVIGDLKNGASTSSTATKTPSIECVPQSTRFKLALKVFRHTAAYDAMIAGYLQTKLADSGDGDQTQAATLEMPEQLTLTYEKIQTLRYGENAHQQGTYYKEIQPYSGALVNAVQLHGKELSYNNINDANGALECLKEFVCGIDEPGCCGAIKTGIGCCKPAVVAVKHANPCGVATGDTLADAYKKAHDCDPVSIFGGIVALSQPVDLETAQEISKIFVEIVLAPGFAPEALELLSKKPSIRLLQLDDIGGKPAAPRLDLKKVSGGLLVQNADDILFNQDDLKCVTTAKPTEEQMADMEMAMKVVKHVKSNGIVFVKNGQTIAIGPGQTNRIWAVKNAIRQCNYDMKGCVMASDAFFPFDDCVTEAAAAGAVAIIQPGGSMRDQDSIDKANELGIVMVFTGTRHFKH